MMETLPYILNKLTENLCSGNAGKGAKFRLE